MSTEWWIIDRRTGQVVNVVTRDAFGPPDLSRFVIGEYCYATTKPTEQQMTSYRYWAERP